MRRVRQTAPRSQGKDGGCPQRVLGRDPVFAQHHTLSSRRRAHRRTADGSGERAGSSYCGVAYSIESPAAIRSQAPLSARQTELRLRHQLIGQDREGSLARRTKPAAHREASEPLGVGLAESPSAPDDRVARQTGHQRGRRSNGITPVRTKRTTAGVMAAAGRRQAPLQSAGGPSVPGKVSFERKEKNTAFCGPS
jgi:hypothetical protein